MTRIAKLTSYDLKTWVCHWLAQSGQTFLWIKLATEGATQASKIRMLQPGIRSPVLSCLPEGNELNGKSFKIPLCTGDDLLTFSPVFVTAAKVSLALFTTLGEVYSM